MPIATWLHGCMAGCFYDITSELLTRSSQNVYFYIYAYVYHIFYVNVFEGAVQWLRISNFILAVHLCLCASSVFYNQRRCSSLQENLHYKCKFLYVNHQYIIVFYTQKCRTQFTYCKYWGSILRTLWIRNLTTSTACWLSGPDRVRDRGCLDSPTAVSGTTSDTYTL